MGFLRNVFGPSREEMWRQLCSQIDATYVDGGWRGDKVLARHGDWVLTLDTYTVHAGNAHIPFTRMRAPYMNPSGFRFQVYRRSLFTNLGKLLGMQDVEVGVEAFDRDFVIKGTDEARLRELFQNARIRELVAAQPSIHFGVEDADRGWFGPSVHEDADELVFRVSGIVKDVERLKDVYDLFAETLDQLTRMGASSGAAQPQST